MCKAVAAGVACAVDRGCIEKLTGTRQIDASAITESFAPRLEWLRQQNQGKECGWGAE